MNHSNFEYTGGPVTSTGTPIINQTNLGTNSYANRNWWKIGLAAFAGLLTGGLVGGIIAGIGAYCASKTTDISQLLPGEYETVTNWFKTSFTQYFNTLIIEGNNLLANNFNAASLPQLNELQKKLCVLKNYYANINSDTTLSDAALDFRYELIEPFISAVEDLLQAKAETLHAHPANASVNVANYNMSPLIAKQSGIITCTIYTLEQQPIATNQSISVATKDNKPGMAWFWFALATGAVVLMLSVKDKDAKMNDAEEAENP